MSGKGVCRTAPATPGLFKKYFDREMVKNSHPNFFNKFGCIGVDPTKSKCMWIFKICLTEHPNILECFRTKQNNILTY